MDASNILAALATGDVELLFGELDWDQREDLTLSDGSKAVVGRVGLYGLAWSEETGLDVHEHPDLETAIDCTTGKAMLIREATAAILMAQMGPEIQADLASLDNPYEGRHAAPDTYWI